MFSQRIAGALATNALAARTAQLRASGAPLLDLTESNPTQAGLAQPAAILTALADPRARVYEPDPRGLLAARDAVCGYYGDAHGVTVLPERVLLTASTSEAYALLFKLLCDPGDDVLVPRPSYPLFDLLAALECVHTSPYALGYDGAWHLDLGALERAITPRSRAVVVVNPNNPTGSFLKRDELGALVALCAARGLAIVSDEVFADYAFDDDARRVRTVAAEQGALCFALSGLSKTCALPQLKLGWIVVSGPGALVAEASARLELIADTFLSVGAPVQHAAASLLAGREAIQARVRERTRGNRAHLLGALARAAGGCHALHTEGGWYTVLRVPSVVSEEHWALALLERDGVIVHPGYFFDFAREAYLVVSLLTEPTVFREGVARLLARVDAR